MTCKHGLRADECAYCTGLIKQASEIRNRERKPAPIRDFLVAYQHSFYSNEEWGTALKQERTG